MNSRVLLVGLGGIGSEIVSNVEKMAAETHKNNIRFAILDTDVNTLNRIKREGFGGKVIQISDNMTVGQCYEVYKKSNERWYLDNKLLADKPMTEGAGQVRAVSRLAFEQTKKKGALHPLEQCLTDLFETNSSDTGTALRILIVSSLAGGTGSGIILPAALYLRECLATQKKCKAVIVRGIFLTADCFFSILRSEYERKSLAGNAYAAIKELNAFMQKTDGYLPKRYDNIFLNSKDEKTISYNYCYLFSANNEKAYGLSSFQALKDYIGQCIYAQALSPMQELNNSIEDNVLKSTMTGGSENIEFKRYCASGIQVLRYPYKEILKYLALNKSVEILSEEWMAVDFAYNKELEKLREREKEGIYAEEPDMGEFFIRYIVTADENDSVAETIVNATTYNGDNTWLLYMNAIEENVADLTNQILKKCEGKKERAQQVLKILENKKDHTKDRVMKLVNHFEEYFVACDEELNKMTDSYTQRYLRIPSGRKPEPYHFEYWCQDRNGFIHLSAIRYFLYQVLEMVRDKIEKMESELDKQESFLVHIKDYSVIGRVSEEGKADEELKRISKYSIKNNWWPGLRGKVSKIHDVYMEGMDTLNEYSRNRLHKRVLEVVRKELMNILENLQKFYGAFYYNRELYHNRQESILTEFRNDSGTAVHYIGVIPEYLETVLERVTNVVKDRNTNRMLSELIFQSMKTMDTYDEESRNQGIEKLYQQDIPEYWEKNLVSEYGNILNINIIDAIIQEGNYIKPDEHKYLEMRLEQAWKETIPRLLIGDGIKGQERCFCLYHSSLKDIKGGAEAIINTKLVQTGGAETDDESNRYSITFYKVVYNLRASDIADFSVGSPEIESVHDSGYSFRSYYQIAAMQSQTKLSPHIDKTWSSIFNMPDINNIYTEIRIKHVYKAVFWAWQEKYFEVERDENSERKKVYKYIGNRKNKEVDLKGSFKKVIEEMSAQYEIVEYLHREMNEVLKKEQDDGCRLEETHFWNSIWERAKEGRHLWEFPYEYLQQEAERLWDNELICFMVEAVMEQVMDIISMFCDEDEVSRYYKKLVLHQVSLLAQDNEGRRCLGEIRRYLQKKKRFDIDQEIQFSRRG